MMCDYDRVVNETFQLTLNIRLANLNHYSIVFCKTIQCRSPINFMQSVNEVQGFIFKRFLSQSLNLKFVATVHDT